MVESRVTSGGLVSGEVGVGFRGKGEGESVGLGVTFGVWVIGWVGDGEGLRAIMGVEAGVEVEGVFKPSESEMSKRTLSTCSSRLVPSHHQSSPMPTIKLIG